MLDDEATLVLLPLDCLAVLGSSHVGTGTQAARTGGARAPHRGDGPRTRRAAGLGRGHHPPARRAHRIQPARPLQPLPRQTGDHRRRRPRGRRRDGRGGAGRDLRRGRPARPGHRPRPRLPRLRRTQPGGLRRLVPARRRPGVRAGGHPGTSQGRLRRAAGEPGRGRRGRRPPGAVHRGVLGVPARPGDPDPGGTAAAGGRRAEGGAAGGPARHGLTHRPGGQRPGPPARRCLPATTLPVTGVHTTRPQTTGSAPWRRSIAFLLDGLVSSSTPPAAVRAHHLPHHPRSLHRRRGAGAVDPNLHRLHRHPRPGNRRSCPRLAQRHPLRRNRNRHRRSRCRRRRPRVLRRSRGHHRSRRVFLDNATWPGRPRVPLAGLGSRTRIGHDFPHPRTLDVPAACQRLHPYRRGRAHVGHTRDGLERAEPALPHSVAVPGLPSPRPSHPPPTRRHRDPDQ